MANKRTEKRGKIFPRFLKYKLLSNSYTTIGNPIYNQPTLLTGKGMLIFKENVNLGVKPSPYLYDGYGYIESRGKDSGIVIRKNVWINNNFIIISESE
ncbi:MAG: hypothetical protein L3J74_14025, partial [Bacteroidales bacterium]|nr:hypothetical protein [Bacteroidales bacterium]